MSEGKSLLNWREPYITPDGESGWVDTNKWPIKDRDGNVIGLFGISRDITQLVKAEETLKKSEENFRQLFEHSSSGIAVHELVYDSKEQPEDYILLNVNPSYCEILNLNADLVQGQRASQVYGVSPAPLLSEYASIVRTQKSIEFEFSFEEINKWFKIKAYSHQPDCFVTVFEDIEDITESKKAQEERERLISELKRALDEVKTLSGLLPLCASCKKIRDDKGYWNQIESYIQQHSSAVFSHGLCST